MKTEPRGQGRPSTTDRIYTNDEKEFIMAMDDWKRKTGTKFPTVVDHLKVLYSLGYTKCSPMTS